MHINDDVSLYGSCVCVCVWYGGGRAGEGGAGEGKGGEGRGGKGYNKIIWFYH